MDAVARFVYISGGIVRVDELMLHFDAHPEVAAAFYAATAPARALKKAMLRGAEHGLCWHLADPDGHEVGAVITHCVTAAQEATFAQLPRRVPRALAALDSCLATLAGHRLKMGNLPVFYAAFPQDAAFIRRRCRNVTNFVRRYDPQQTRLAATETAVWRVAHAAPTVSDMEEQEGSLPVNSTWGSPAEESTDATGSDSDGMPYSTANEEEQGGGGWGSSGEDWGTGGDSREQQEQAVVASVATITEEEEEEDAGQEEGVEEGKEEEEEEKEEEEEDYLDHQQQCHHGRDHVLEIEQILDPMVEYATPTDVDEVETASSSHAPVLQWDTSTFCLPVCAAHVASNVAAQPAVTDKTMGTTTDVDGNETQQEVERRSRGSFPAAITVTISTAIPIHIPLSPAPGHHHAQGLAARRQHVMASIQCLELVARVIANLRVFRSPPPVMIRPMLFASVRWMPTRSPSPRQPSRPHPRHCHTSSAHIVRGTRKVAVTSSRAIRMEENKEASDDSLNDGLPTVPDDGECISELVSRYPLIPPTSDLVLDIPAIEMVTKPPAPVVGTRLLTPASTGKSLEWKISNARGSSTCASHATSLLLLPSRALGPEMHP